MEEVIAKKYTHALIKAYDSAVLKNFLEILTKISQAFYIEKFRDIIGSPYIGKQSKKDLILSLSPTSKEVERLIDLLIQGNRLDILPFITMELEKYLRSLDNNHKAILYAPKNLDSTTISNISNSLSKRLGTTLTIEQSPTKIDGIRLVVEDLGVEISFLKKRFFEDLKNHILKAI